MTTGVANGTGRLLGFALRRDRVYLGVWSTSLTALHVLSIWSMVALYGEEAERRSLVAGAVKSGVALAFNGLVSGDDLASVTMSQTLLVMCTGAALMSTFAVVRHTRQDEEVGRTDLLVAGAIGRRAPLLAALALVAAANLVLAVVNALALVAFGFAVAGSIAAGLAIGAAGLAFGAIAAVAAQVGSTARAANGLAGAALAVAFALRGFGDLSGSVDASGVRVISAWPSWLSPLGWAQQIRPYDRDAWWLLGVLLLFAVVVAALAVALLGHRDLGSGMVPTRPGPPTARPSLVSPLGLAWRLQRTVLFAWLVTMVLLGLAFGAISPEVEELVGTSEGTVDILEGFGGSGALVEVYLAATVAMAGIGVAAYAVQAALRVESEESSGRAETVLVRPVARSRWLGAHVLVVVAGTVLLLLVEGAATGFAYGLTAEDPLGATGTYARAALLQAPAALVLGGVAVLMFGISGRRSRAIAWAVYAACVVLGQLGDLLRLPDLVLRLSPFGHLPAVPVEPAALAPVAILSALAVVFVAVGIDRFGRRDLDTA